MISNNTKISILCAIIAFIIVKSIDIIDHSMTNIWFATGVIFLCLVIAHKKLLIPFEMLIALITFASIGTMGSVIRIIIGLSF